MDLSAKHYVDTSHYLSLAQTASGVCVENHVKRYPLNPVLLANHYGIKVLSYERFSRVSGNSLEELVKISPDGFSMFKDNAPVVAYNTAVENKGRRRWTLLHEISHVLLGHITQQQPSIYTLSETQRRWLETDAEDLTACLIAPLGVAHLCNIQSPAEMKTVFGLSKESARYFYRDLASLRTSGHINRLLFPESVNLCLSFIADRLTLQYRLQQGMLRPAPCLDVVYDEAYSQ